MNVELLEKVIAHIEEEPRRFHMNTWLDSDKMVFEELGIEPPSCGTVGCIAGWGGKLAEREEVEEKEPFGSGWFDFAADLFEVSVMQAYRLCLQSDWPYPYQHQYARAVGAKDWNQAVKIAVERIRFFIETNGTDRTEEAGLKED